MSGAAGVLLTGGASTRMGADKASLVVGGQPMAARLGELLARGLVGPVVEVGPGRSGLPAVAEDVPGQGPLVAVATAAQALAARGWRGPAVVLACDLPLFSPAALDLLARWPGGGAVLPVLGGRRQPLCARWAAADLAAAVRRAALGERSLHGLPGIGGCAVLREEDLRPPAGPEAFADVDEPADLVALGLAGTPVSAVVAPGRGAR